MTLHLQQNRIWYILYSDRNKLAYILVPGTAAHTETRAQIVIYFIVKAAFFSIFLSQKCRKRTRSDTIYKILLCKKFCVVHLHKDLRDTLRIAVRFLTSESIFAIIIRTYPLPDNGRHTTDISSHSDVTDNGGLFSERALILCFRRRLRFLRNNSTLY